MKIVLRHQDGSAKIITLLKGYPEKVGPQMKYNRSSVPSHNKFPIQYFEQITFLAHGKCQIQLPNPSAESFFILSNYKSQCLNTKPHIVKNKLRKESKLLWSTNKIYNNLSFSTICAQKVHKNLKTTLLQSY